jgi:hypothetical protein
MSGSPALNGARVPAAARHLLNSRMYLRLCTKRTRYECPAHERLQSAEPMRLRGRTVATGKILDACPLMDASPAVLVVGDLHHAPGYEERLRTLACPSRSCRASTTRPR